MAEVSTKLTKMVDAEPNFISLVKAGANRIAFRITKTAGEETMDLSNPFKRPVKKAEAAKPTVLAIAVEKAEDMEAVKAALTGAGFSVEKAEEQDDGTVVFPQVDGELPDDAAVVRVSDNMVAVVKGLNEDDLKDFAAVIGAEECVAGADLATAALKNEVQKLLGEDDAADKIAKAVEAHGKYVAALVAQLPGSVFKADTALGVAKAEAVKKAEEAAKAADDAEKAAKAEADAAEKAKKDADEAKARDEAAAAGDIDAKIAKALEGLPGLVTAAVQAAVAPVAEQVAAAQNQLKEVAAKAEKAEQAVKGTVVNPPLDGDRAKATKEEGDKNFVPFTDSALMRKSAHARKLHG